MEEGISYIELVEQIMEGLQQALTEDNSTQEIVEQIANIACKNNELKTQLKDLRQKYEELLQMQ